MVKVDKFIFPADLVVLDREPIKISSRKIPVILGRPFMATANTIIDVKKGILTMTVGDMTVEFNVFKSSQQPDRMLCSEHDREFGFILTKCPLEACLAHFGMDFDIESSVSEVNALLDAAPVLNITTWQSKFEPLLYYSSPPLVT